MNKKQKGFSLIELLIVVAIILIIAAIAIPNLLRSKMAANQASAVGSVRTINTAAITYFSTYGNGYPFAMSAIGNNGTTSISCTNAELIDTVLTGNGTTGTKSGYNITFVKSATAANQVNSSSSSCTGNYGYSDGFMSTATPVSVGTSGQNAYCSDGSGVIRVNTQGTTNTGPSPNCATTDTPLNN